ncbi:MAG: hypothetical protein A3K60_07040 [Euryarchaeota archaeon RBG_19FT_COMBO_56_21]|nr:MAG: hypothetical protein A3K60_07040 [Euryarchaeota archaeon RBG_19FT_COMBO_56_21]
MNDATIGNLPDLWRETYDIVAQVPLGRLTTYGAVAEALGDIIASRFVGLAMSWNDDIVRVPCRRVVQSDGKIGGYTGGGPEKKIRLLRSEGIEISGSRIIGLERYMFRDFETSHPLRALRKKQVLLKKHLSLSPLKSIPSRVAGVDVAYSNDHAYGAMVTFDYESGEEIDRVVVEGDAKFPYVPSYLAFREIPVIAPLLRLVAKGTVIMYDGNGILHPEGFGIASQVGVVFGLPSVGVAKKLLCGTVTRTSNVRIPEVRIGRHVIGHALQGEKSTRPIYISAGHGLSPKQATAIASRFLKHRIPEPTRVAHIVAEAARKGTSHK